MRLAEFTFGIDPCRVPVEDMAIGIICGKFDALPVDPVRFCPLCTASRPFPGATGEDREQDDGFACVEQSRNDPRPCIGNRLACLHHHVVGAGIDDDQIEIRFQQSR